MISKVGITTYYDSYNEGTLLQAYSVKTLLQNELSEATIEMLGYRFRPRSLPKYLLDIRKPMRNYYRFAREMKIRRFVRDHIYSARQLITPDYNKALQLAQNGRYDMLITGSDTVWQILGDPAVPSFPNIYWLPKELRCLKVAMAVSANNTKIAELDAQSQKFIKDCLEDYFLIGVRDDVTQQLVTELCPGVEEKVLRVPDPTFAIDFPKTQVKQKLINAGFDLNRPIIGFNLPDTPLIRLLLMHFVKKSYQLLPFAYNDLMNLPGARCVSMSPFEWAEVYRYLSLCITERFHGGVFSLKSKCPFLALDFSPSCPGSTNKIYSLLKEFDLLNRHLVMYDSPVTPEFLIERASMCEEKLDEGKMDEMLQFCKKTWDEFLLRLREKLIAYE